MMMLSHVILRTLSSRCTSLIDSNPPLVGQGIAVKGFLRENSIPFDESWTSIKAQCCRNSGWIHFNKQSGDFACTKCSTIGTWKEFEHQSTLIRTRTLCPKIGPAKNLLSDEEKRMWDLAEPIENQEKQVIEALLTRFGFNEESMLNSTTLQRYGLRIYQDQFLVPLYDFDRSLIRLHRLEMKNNEQEILKHSAPFGLNLINARNAEILIADSIWDALCLYQATGKIAIVLPSTRISIPVNMALEHLRKIQIWCSNDKALAFRLANHFNPHRCFLITYPQSALIAFQSAQNLKSIVNESFAVINKCIEQFDSFRALIRDELLQRTRYAGVQWKRFPTLTQILKGHRPGELTVLTGPTGCGKTTFLSEYSLDLCIQGVSTLFGSFEIQTHRLAKVMLTQYSGLNLGKNMHVFEQFADQFSRLPMFFMTFHGEESIERVIHTMGHAVAIHNIQHVVIDNLQFMMGMDYSNGDRFFKQDTLIHRFRKFATNNKCHVTIVIHPRKEDDVEELAISSIFGSAKASQESDNILIIQQRKLATSQGNQIKYLQIAKNRFDGQLGRLPLRFDKERLSFSRPAASPGNAEEADEHEVTANGSVLLNSQG